MVSFLFPALLAGTVMVVVPWILHHIRRPEREPVEFSSLLFVPHVKKEVIERRRIQHWLLMLLRMLLFLLLFLAFSRPFWTSDIAAEIDENTTINAILLDVSYSMGMDGRFAEGKEKAASILSSLSTNDYVKLIPFHRKPLADFDLNMREVSAAASQETMARELQRAALSNESTDFVSCLQDVERELLNAVQGMDENEPRLKIYLISDMQRVGMAKETSGWKLSSKMELEVVSLQEEYEAPNNVSVLDTHVRDRQDNLRVVGKIKNWTGEDKEIPVDLWVNNEMAATRDVYVKAGNASQVFFNMQKTKQVFSGRLEVDEDDLNRDNRHYFVKNPDAEIPVTLVSNFYQDVNSSAWFIHQALTYSEKMPWDVTTLPLADALVEANDDSSILLVSDWSGLNSNRLDILLQTWNAGMKAIFFLDETANQDTLTAYLTGLNIRNDGVSRETFDPRRYSLISRIDFDHPVFTIFQGEKFNDFTSYRFYRYYRLNVEESSEQSNRMARVISYFESEENDTAYPSLVEMSNENSRILIVPYAMKLDWTNFPKSKKFVPLLHEMLFYLYGETGHQDHWTVGEAIAVYPEMEGNEESASYRYSTQESNTWQDWVGNEKTVYDEPGLLQWRQEIENEQKHYVYAINVDSEEADVEPVPADEFVLRYCASPNLERIDTKEDTLIEEETVQRNEYGIFFVIAVAGLLMLEMWYSSRLT